MEEQRISRIDLKVGYRCNNRCRFCAQGNKREYAGETTTDSVIGILETSSGKCNEVVFTGGEPTLRPEIIEWVNKASALGYDIVQIQSNGRAFSNKKFCREMIAAGANQFALSLHGHDENCHDYLVRAPGAFLQTTTGIMNLLEMGQDVVVNVVVNRSNFRVLPQIAKLLTMLGVKNFQFAFVHAVGTAGENFKSIVARKTLAAPYIKRGIDMGVSHGAVVYTEGVPYCFMQGYENSVVEIKIPRCKIHEGGRVIEDFTTVRRNEAKGHGPECSKCSFFKLCEGPWIEYPTNYGWSEFIPRCDAADHKIVEMLVKQYENVTA